LTEIRGGDGIIIYIKYIYIIILDIYILSGELDGNTRGENNGINYKKYLYII
jgi:hypothetical protein